MGSTYQCENRGFPFLLKLLFYIMIKKFYRGQKLMINKIPHFLQDHKKIIRFVWYSSNVLLRLTQNSNLSSG